MKLKEFLASLENTRARNALWQNLIVIGPLRRGKHGGYVYVPCTEDDTLEYAFSDITKYDLEKMVGIANKTANYIAEQLKNNGLALKDRQPKRCPRCRQEIKE